MENIKLSAPWYTYLHELEAMFEDDPDIIIHYDDEDKKISVFCSKLTKATALEKILKHEQVLGNVTLKIDVIFPNEEGDISDVFNDAFRDNPSLSFATSIDSPLGTHRYVVFAKKVVQFYNDQMDDIYGNKSMLFQDIAKDIFNPGLAVNYCTERSDL